MTEPYPLPPAGSLDALLDVLAGWHEAGAAAEPRRAEEVERLTGTDDVVRQHLPFLEQVGALEPVGRAHRLTDAGAELGEALAAGDDRRARAAARSLLGGHPFVDDLAGVLRANPLPEENLRPLLAALAGWDADRTIPGVSPVLDLLEWAGLLVRDATGRYGVPREVAPMPDGSGSPGDAPGGVPAGQQPPPPPDQRPASRSRAPPASEPPQQPSEPAGGPPQQLADSGGGPPVPASDQEPARYATQEYALSVRLSVDNLELDVDGDANELEEIVRAVRRGLVPDDALGS